MVLEEIVGVLSVGVRHNLFRFSQMEGINDHFSTEKKVQGALNELSFQLLLGIDT